jgi:hypothetical protein
MKTKLECLWKNYQTVQEQVLFLEFDQEQAKNISKLIEYEQKVLIAASDIEQIVKAYPDEFSSGIFVLLVGGKLVAVNNYRAISGHLKRNEFYYLGKPILIHELGKNLDFELLGKINSKPSSYHINPCPLPADFS